MVFKVNPESHGAGGGSASETPEMGEGMCFLECCFCFFSPDGQLLPQLYSSIEQTKLRVPSNVVSQPGDPPAHPVE